MWRQGLVTDVNELMRKVRTAIWHFRRGGVAQVKEWRSRQVVGARIVPTQSAPKTRRVWSCVQAPQMRLPDYRPIARAPRFQSLRVGAIMDDFSRSSWSGEFALVSLQRGNWSSQFDDGLDFIFLESAWSGNGGQWSGAMVGASGPSDELRRLVADAKARNIPVVFWNKEDPPHFDDFIMTARLADIVFTTDADLIPKYRKVVGHDRVYCLPFAAQVNIHNPVRMREVSRIWDVAFAGMYFAEKYPERREQMELLLGAAIDVAPRMETGLTIYSRQAGGEEKYQFPEPYEDYVVGSLPYSKMLSAYRAFKVFLNVSSVNSSHTMCPRRVFELTASGASVVSTQNVAISQFFREGEVVQVADRREAGLVIRGLVANQELRDRMAHLGQRRIWRSHTYTHRAIDICEKLGLGIPASFTNRPRVSVIVSTNRPDQIDNIVENIGRQREVNTELLLLTHGFTISRQRLAEQLQLVDVENFELLEASATESLGTCLNKLVARAGGAFIAKMDDDDLYGEWYLADSINALRYSGADLVGKRACHMFLAGRNVTVLRSPNHEHVWTHFVAGPTLVGPRETFLARPFEDRTRGEDSAFLKSIRDAGGRIYAADRFNFVQMRSAKPLDHTWAVADEEILANSRVVHFGAPGDQVFF